MRAKTNESPGIKSKVDDVADAVAAVKRDLIEVLGPSLDSWPWKKSSGTFSRQENLRFSRELRGRDPSPTAP